MVLADRLKLVVGDITKLPVDAVVTAANEALCGGGGVDGAIHRAAGPALLEECLKIGHCPQGEARITKGYLLQAKFIIHTVGPVWEGGGYGERELLASCYQASLKLAAEHGADVIAFSCIATGTYGYPKGEACEVAVGTVLAWLRTQELPRQIVFCCFEEAVIELSQHFGIARLPRQIVFCCFEEDDAEMYRARLAAVGASA